MSRVQLSPNIFGMCGKCSTYFYFILLFMKGMSINNK